MKRDQELCDIYLNNQHFVFDDAGKVFRSTSGLTAKAVTMEQVRGGSVHAGLAPTYVIGGVPYYYDEERDELMGVLDRRRRVGASEYRVLLAVGAVSAPRGQEFKRLMDKAKARLGRKERER